ncbi:hypothetical protein B0A69_08990 [Chryseobacterium shigense]|uniref:Uncharacterized protein n=1 Tax=Chryseobacterium shigense TaxID=297244 RepID=A0A1N7IFR8_9FLAO|nr:hypothetical protein B0A69_08990 [Chryseobacterium shigense]SIS35954.1 hypothetical protein SAMN05421639_103585 [Chryseobacterium shigense]
MSYIITTLYDGNQKLPYFVSKTSECDALIQNGAFFMELDAAATMESIGRKGGINPDAICSISSNRRFALVYKDEIVAQGSRYNKAYQKTLMDLRRVSYNAEKVGEYLETIINRRRIVSVEDASLLNTPTQRKTHAGFSFQKINHKILFAVNQRVIRMFRLFSKSHARFL